MRCHTFNNANDVNSNTMKISSDDRKNNENSTCQSTPELNCSNERETNEFTVNREQSTNGATLSSASLIGLTPTSSGTVDDKNEVCICYFLFSHCFIETYYQKKLSDRR